jgi:hypothetical protein
VTVVDVDTVMGKEGSSDQVWGTAADYVAALNTKYQELAQHRSLASVVIPSFILLFFSCRFSSALFSLFLCFMSVYSRNILSFLLIYYHLIIFSPPLILYLNLFRCIP